MDSISKSFFDATYKQVLYIELHTKSLQIF